MNALTAPAPLPHILVVDDDQRLRDLLRRYLVDNGFAVSTAADAQEARRALGILQFDLMVLDVMMPGESGLELTRSLRPDSDTPILLLTAMGEVDDRIAGLESGADDYLPKPFEARELLVRIRTILRRTAVPEPVSAKGIAPLRLGDIVFDADRQLLRRGEDVIRLSQAEAALLATFAARPGVALSRDDLVDAAGAGPGAATAQGRAIDVQVTRLRRKIEPDPKFPRYLQTVRGKGYMLQPD